MLKILICGYRCEETFERCDASIEMQTFPDWMSFNCIENDVGRRYLVHNTAESIGQMGCDPEDIIVCIDADDWLIDEQAFGIIYDAYAADPNLLLTYGSYVNLSSNKRGKFCGEYLPDESFRTAGWRGSHLKTFKYKLWKRLDHSQLQWPNGEWFKCCADRAIMIPLMEMAGHDRIKYINMLLYCYNDENPLSVWKTNRELSVTTRSYIAGRPPLQRIESL